MTTAQTVWRALKMVEGFDWVDEENRKLKGWPGPKLDWRDVPLTVWRKVDLPLRPENPQIEELWRRHRDGTLTQQILKMAENLDMDKVSKAKRKEIEDGLDRLNTTAGR